MATNALLEELNSQLLRPQLDLNRLFALFSAVLNTAAGTVDQMRTQFQPFVPIAEHAATRSRQALQTALGAEGRGNIAVVFKAIAEVLMLAGEGPQAIPLLVDALGIFRQLRIPGLDVSHLAQQCAALLTFLGQQADGSAIPELPACRPPAQPAPAPVIEATMEQGAGFVVMRGVLEPVIDLEAVAELDDRQQDIFRARIRNGQTDPPGSSTRSQNRLEGQPCNLPPRVAAMQHAIVDTIRELTGFGSRDYDVEQFVLLSRPPLAVQGLHSDNLWVGSDRRGASLFWPINKPAEYVVVPDSHKHEADHVRLQQETLQLLPGDLLVIHPMLAHAGGCFNEGLDQSGLRGFAFADITWLVGTKGWRRLANQASQWWPECVPMD